MNTIRTQQDGSIVIFFNSIGDFNHAWTFVEATTAFEIAKGKQVPNSEELIGNDEEKNIPCLKFEFKNRDFLYSFFDSMVAALVMERRVDEASVLRKIKNALNFYEDDARPN